MWSPVQPAMKAKLIELTETTEEELYNRKNDEFPAFISTI